MLALVRGAAPDRLGALWRPCAAEFLGSFILLFFCCAPIVSRFEPASDGRHSLDAAALRGGLSTAIVVCTIVWTFGHVSGAHVNPSLTAAMLLTGDIPLVRALLYIPAQCAGGVAGTMALKLVMPFQLHNSTTLGLTAFNAALTHPAQAVCAELLLTFVMVLPIYAGTDRLRFDQTGSVALTSGLQVGGCILAGASLSGSSMNPIRTLGPAVVLGRCNQLWVYIVGPTCGACLAGLVYRGLLLSSRQQPSSAAAEPAVEEAEAINLAGSDSKGNSAF